MALRAGEVGEMRRYERAWVALHSGTLTGIFYLRGVRKVGYRNEMQDKGVIDYLSWNQELEERGSEDVPDQRAHQHCLLH